MKCPICKKELPEFFKCYTKSACHEIHINAEKYRKEIKLMKNEYQGNY